jgi:hypothetical protein
MSTTDESQNLDAGWGDDAPGEAEIDEAWDSVPLPVSAPTSGSLSVAPPPSVAVETQEVDGGWDDAPAGAPAGKDGKRRPHRQRKAKSGVTASAANPVLLPRPAEPTKKHQREHARQQRLREAQTKQQRKEERKTQRAAEAREQAAERLRQAEAAQRARKMRREARERAESERPAPKPANPAKSSQKAAMRKAAAAARSAELKSAPESERARVKPKSGLRPGVIITLLVVAAAIALLALRN